ncbi:MAG: hemolysin D [Rickettsiales bacterium]|nr:hemolysin D [Rickettsiales bacterium]
MTSSITYYRKAEEIMNVITHLVGLILSVAGLALLVTFASLYGTVWHIVSFSIFGATLVLLYLASTLYHAARSKQLRRRLNIFDHSAIYLLIAGTYTPFCLVALNGWVGWTLFGVTWGLAVAGVVLKVFFTGRYNLLSTIGYVAMGWIAIVAAKPLYQELNDGALLFLLIGGVSYTIGAVFYMIDKIKFNHAIFHLWVLLGSIAHFIAIFFFLL